MKKVIPAILLFFFFHSVSVSQTVNKRIQVVENNGANFVCKVQVNVDNDTALIGNAVSRIRFNPKAISFSSDPKPGIDYSFNNFLSPDYSDYLSSVKQPNNGTISINIINISTNAYQVTDDYTDIATLKFKTVSQMHDKNIECNMRQFFAPFSTSIWDVGTWSISALSENYIPVLLSPFNNEIIPNNSVTFSWQKIAQAIQYILEISLDKSFSQIVYSVDNITSTVVIVKNIGNGTKYFWRVRSITQKGQSHFSKSSSFIIPIEKPSDLNSSSPSNNQYVELNWQNNSASAQYIVIERKKSGSQNTEDYTSIDTIDASRSSYIDALIEEEQSYVYRVRAVNENTASIYSDSTTITMSLSKSKVENDLPKDFQLHQNYPNPFNPTTTINYSVKENSHISITIYSLLGEKITTLVDKGQNAGNYDIIWNASNYPSGIYIYVMTAESNVSKNTFQNVKKMILLK